MQQNYHFWTFSIFCFFLLAGCAKEQDITTTTITVEDPKEGVLVPLSGTVVDSTGIGVSEASVRFQNGDYRHDVLTDEKGVYELEVPEDLLNGFISSNKVGFTKSIIRVDPAYHQNQVQDIFLLRRAANNEVELEINEDELIVVKGKFVDQFDRSYAAINISGSANDQDGNQVRYATKSREDGTFEIVLDYREFVRHTIFYFADQSGECLLAPLLLLSLPPDTIVDAGKIVMERLSEFTFMPNIIVESCDIPYTNHIYVPGTRVLVQKLLLPGEELTLCDSTIGQNPIIYSGVFSDNRTSFDGGFIKLEDWDTPQELSMCMPDGFFIEVRMENDTLWFFETSYEPASIMTITGSNETEKISFTMTNKWSFSSSEGRFILRTVGALQIRDLDDKVLYELDQSGFNIANAVVESSRFGVLTAELIDRNGDSKVVTIRFKA